MSLLEPPHAQTRLSALTLGVVVLLLVWNPLSLALVTASAWPRLVRYGLPAWGLLGLRVAVVVLGMIAARWMIDRDARGRRLAAATFAAAALLPVVVALTPYFYSNAEPSTKWLRVIISVTFNAVLGLAMLRNDSPGAPPFPPRQRLDTVEPPEPGKIANLVVTNGDPLELRTTGSCTCSSSASLFRSNRHQNLYDLNRPRPQSSR